MKDENNGINDRICQTQSEDVCDEDDKKDTKMAKGVKNNIITITFDNYVRCLNKKIEMTRVYDRNYMRYTWYSNRKSL